MIGTGTGEATMAGGGAIAVTPAATEHDTAAAEQTLARLNAEATALRGELVRLRASLAELQRETTAAHAADLRDANKTLVLAALHAQTIAETATKNLTKLARSSQRDSLTGTPNRALILDRLETAIAMARRRGTRIAVLFVDLDDFKNINDTLGHGAGDEALRLVARRLRSVVRHSDAVSRYGGDEFLVLLTDISKPADAARVAAKMLSILPAPSRSDGHQFHQSASIGIAVFPEDGGSAMELIRNADAAMYRSKRSGPGQFQFHSGERSADALVGSRSADESERGAGSPAGDAAATHERRFQDLRAANEKLVVAALTAQEMGAQAAAVNRRQIRFLAIVAHELRNPLTPIRTAAELLTHARADRSLLERVQAIIGRQVGLMSRLVDDLLDLSRVSEGKLRVERDFCDFADILEIVVDACRTAIAGKRQTLKLALPPRPIGIDGDPVRLAQVFTNLLDNASKYTQEGGEIALTATIRDSDLVVSVADNGSGIVDSNLSSIFDLFSQDLRVQQLHNGGLGIGLAVVRELVEAHGGTVAAKSAGIDQGSEFIVTLPIAGDRLPH